MKASRIQINGIVQGVGFRPFVYRIAMENNLNGWVQNTSGGVIIEVEGRDEDLRQFISLLQLDLPPLARVETFREETIPHTGYSGFAIKPSEKISQAYSLVSPDAAICPDCARELFDPRDRRYRYPFINCTNCGPRFTIIRDMPYDRPYTTMSTFPMCPDCDHEYHHPLDRRFHAQPIACPVCGPQVTLLDASGRLAEKEEAVQQTRKLIRQGRIAAIKGLGGYLLACDAHNPHAVQALRSRKKRSQKPFALMAFSSEIIQNYCTVEDGELQLLQSRQMPIVLLAKKSTSTLPQEIAPTQHNFGFMLPYTPLHLLLCEPQQGYPDVLVMTSANISDEPILYQDAEMNRLFELADVVLTHNRPIHIRTDDSVVRFFASTPVPVRRSRGYAPEPVLLPDPQPETLACGALLKNTITLTRSNRAFVSPYIGDLENLDTYESFKSTIAHFENLYQINPQVVACDLHPDFLSSQFAQEYALQKQLPLFRVQHHHAHLAACLAENNWRGDQAIGLCYDGTGLGDDDAIWGGEVLVGGYTDCRREAFLEYMPLPGGDAAIHKPYRIALAYLLALGLPLDRSLPPVAYCPAVELSVLPRQIEKQLNTVFTSSMGRLFDAVAALIGVCCEISYEGQAAIELENIADPECSESYRMVLEPPQIRLRGLFEQVLADLRQGVSPPTISARFHNTLARLSLTICQQFGVELGINDIALSGGVWQNKTLFEKTNVLLVKSGFKIFSHRILPTNDGCISYGQAVIAGTKAMERK